VVAVLPLLVPGPLLGLDRHPVLGEHPLGEAADEGPGQLQGPGDRRPGDHEQAVGVAGALGGVLGHVGRPQGKRRQAALGRGQPQGLVRVAGADGENIRRRPAPAVGEQGGAAGLPAADVSELVPGLYAVRAGLVAQQPRLDATDDAPVQELVVHVQQVLVQERVVAGHGAGVRHGLVPGGGELRQLGQLRGGGLVRVAGEDEYQAVGFPDRVSAYSARRPGGTLGQIRDLAEAAVAAVSPGVVAAAQRLAFHHPHAQRHLAVGAPVIQRVDRTAGPPVKRDLLAREAGSERIPLPDAGRYRDRIPEIWVDPDAPEIGHLLGSDSPGLHGKRLGHMPPLLPVRRSVSPPSVGARRVSRSCRSGRTLDRPGQPWRRRRGR